MLITNKHVPGRLVMTHYQAQALPAPVVPQAIFSDQQSLGERLNDKYAKRINEFIGIGKAPA